MYLMPSNSPRINNRKWNLGLVPVRLSGLRGLETPTSAGVQTLSPTYGAPAGGGKTTPAAATPSSDPLDYTSPQAAIAAGLDPNKVYMTWTTALARFSSPQAAIAAGVPAGVVNQLWQSANVQAQTKCCRGLRGLGQSVGTNVCVYYAADGTTIESVDANSNVAECTANGGTWVPAPVATTPSPIPTTLTPPTPAPPMLPASSYVLPQPKPSGFQLTPTTIGIGLGVLALLALGRRR